jgi:hypothetical protein
MTRRTHLICVAFCLVLASSLSLAGDKCAVPFKGRVKATWDNIFDAQFALPASLAGGGPVTHMGDIEQAETLVLGPPIAEGVFPGYGFLTITAANCDKLSLEYGGPLYAETREGVGTFTFTGGTGRFADVTGAGNFYALIDLSFATEQPMSFFLHGEIRC